MCNIQSTTIVRHHNDFFYVGRYGTNDSSYRSPYQSSKDSETASTGSKYTGNRNKLEDSDSVGNRYGAGSGNVGTAGSSGFTSRFLSKSKSSAVVSPEEEEARGASMIGAGASEESRFPLGRTRFAAFKDRKARLARSKSTHTFGVDEFDDFDDASYSPSVYLASKNAALTPGHELSRSRSSHALKSRESSPERSATATQNIQGSFFALFQNYSKSPCPSPPTTALSTPPGTSKQLAWQRHGYKLGTNQCYLPHLPLNKH